MILPASTRTCSVERTAPPLHGFPRRIAAILTARE